MKNAKASSIDVIIIDSTDPLGPAEGLFSESFYRDCFNVLADISKTSAKRLTLKSITDS